jgi:beta-glucosidase
MRNIRYNGVNMGFPSAISTGVMKSPLGNQNIPEAKGTQDFLGLNYYSVDTVWFDITKPAEMFSNGGYPKDADMSDTGMIANIADRNLRLDQMDQSHLPQPADHHHRKWRGRF